MSGEKGSEGQAVTCWSGLGKTGSGLGTWAGASHKQLRAVLTSWWAGVMHAHAGVRIVTGGSGECQKHRRCRHPMSHQQAVGAGDECTGKAWAKAVHGRDYRHLAGKSSGHLSCQSSGLGLAAACCLCLLAGAGTARMQPMFIQRKMLLCDT